MKVVTYVIILIITAVTLVLTMRSPLLQFGNGEAGSHPSPGPEPNAHIYASWDLMEFDKCVSAWLIVRFVDSDAEFVFHPQGTEVAEGVVFDVPGAEWSRKHRQCTSDC